MASIALTFFAFLGFAVISFSGGDLAAPRRQLPVAMYAALAITTVLYVTVALVVFGTLPVDEVVAAGPTALAVAAEPALGQAGFVMMACAALLATASTVTAMLYGSVGLCAALADSGTFPPAFGPGTRLGRHGGLLITAALMVALVTVLSVGALASVGSAVSLAVFVLVAVAAFRLRAELGASPTLTAVAVTVSNLVLVWFVVDLYASDRRSFWAMIVLVGLATVVDEAWTRRRPAAGDRSVSARRISASSRSLWSHCRCGASCHAAPVRCTHALGVSLRGHGGPARGRSARRGAGGHRGARACRARVDHPRRTGARIGGPAGAGAGGWFRGRRGSADRRRAGVAAAGDVAGAARARAALLPRLQSTASWRTRPRPAGRSSRD